MNPILEAEFASLVKRREELMTELKQVQRQINQFRREPYGSGYLRSRHWQAIRREHCGEDARCCACGTAENLQLHHISYERLYAERTGDLIVLCEACHQQLHKFLVSVRKNSKATARVFRRCFRVHWQDSFEVKLPGRRVGMSTAQRKARKTVNRRRKAVRKEAARQPIPPPAFVINPRF